MIVVFIGIAIFAFLKTRPPNPEKVFWVEGQVINYPEIIEECLVIRVDYEKVEIPYIRKWIVRTNNRTVCFESIW